MKYQIILLLFLLSYISSEDCIKISPSKQKDCNEKLSDSDKANGYKYCCYVEANNVKGCLPYTQDEYDAIGKAKENSNSDVKVDGKIECKSVYLTFGLLNLLLFFL